MPTLHPRGVRLSMAAETIDELSGLNTASEGQGSGLAWLAGSKMGPIWTSYWYIVGSSCLCPREAGKAKHVPMRCGRCSGWSGILDSGDPTPRTMPNGLCAEPPEEAVLVVLAPGSWERNHHWVRGGPDLCCCTAESYKESR